MALTWCPFLSVNRLQVGRAVTHAGTGGVSVPPAPAAPAVGRSLPEVHDSDAKRRAARGAPKQHPAGWLLSADVWRRSSADVGMPLPLKRQRAAAESIEGSEHSGSVGSLNRSRCSQGADGTPSRGPSSARDTHHSEPAVQSLRAAAGAPSVSAVHANSGARAQADDPEADPQSDPRAGHEADCHANRHRTDPQADYHANSLRAGPHADTQEVPRSDPKVDVEAASHADSEVESPQPDPRADPKAAAGSVKVHGHSIGPFSTVAAARAHHDKVVIGLGLADPTHCPPGAYTTGDCLAAARQFLSHHPNFWNAHRGDKKASCYHGVR
jgi:hypothetical protein